MSKDAASTTSRSLKDGAASGGLLSKASNSIRRTPSINKHRYQSSNPLPSLQLASHEAQKSESSDGQPRLATRPDIYRTQTAPLPVLTTKSSLKDGKTSQSAGEGSMLVTSLASNPRRDAPGTLSTGTAAITSQNGEQAQAPSTIIGDASYPAAAYMLGNQTSDTLYQHIHEMAIKRMSTLDYFRKAYA
jgi:hypothetical protein